MRHLLFLILYSFPLAVFSADNFTILEEKHSPLRRIGIIFALPEVTPVSFDAKCPIPWFSHSKKSLEGQRIYYSGDSFGKYFVVSALWPNKVSSAVVACNMILKHRVDLILIIGSCYSRSENSRFGNVLISKGYINYDADVRPFFDRFEIPDIKKSIFATSEVHREAILRGGEEFVSVHKKEIEELLKVHGYLKSTTKTEHSLMEGLVATGESFAMSRNYFLSLQKLYPEIYGFDSVSGAVSQVCYEYSIPCLGVNILLPHPLESRSNNDWKHLQSEVSKIYMDTLLKSVLKELCSAH
ncbi:5'-methylthioadenosine nucleosidase [Candidatus Chlamydia corallus]|uniref:5'-methylthioadenosine/S-adenosylhomocysteine nucleosidase family protein n=1 Tax=Candidatus Chlamydia corallus TaxID=2038470 RepID=UPI000C2FBFAF|nr:5'-methylthioadenosine nucleosidase [Candidatus Chlamydia corallus]